MTNSQRPVYLFAAGARFGRALTKPERLEHNLETLNAFAGSWSCFSQAMPWVDQAPHWSWLVATLASNQTGFDYSAWLWTGLDGPRLTGAIYEIALFPTLSTFEPAWVDAMHKLANDYGVRVQFWQNRLFWIWPDVPEGLEGPWGISLGESHAPMVAHELEHDVLTSLQAAGAPVTAACLQPGGWMRRLKSPGWRAVISDDAAIMGLARLTGIPTGRHVRALDPEAIGASLVIDTTLWRYARHNDEASWHDAFVDVHARLLEEARRLEHDTLHYLNSGLSQVCQFSPYKMKPWPLQWLTSQPQHATLTWRDFCES